MPTWSPHGVETRQILQPIATIPQPTVLSRLPAACHSHQTIPFCSVWEKKKKEVTQANFKKPLSAIFSLFLSYAEQSKQTIISPLRTRTKVLCLDSLSPSLKRTKSYPFLLFFPLQDNAWVACLGSRSMLTTPIVTILSSSNFKF